RSMMIAKKTMLIPASNPSAISIRLIETRTCSPSPLAPTIDAMTTIAKAIIVVWLTPAIIVGRACGSCTLESICHLEDPNDWRSEEHTSELQSRFDLVCRLLLDKKKKQSR